MVKLSIRNPFSAIPAESRMTKSAAASVHSRWGLIPRRLISAGLIQALSLILDLAFRIFIYAVSPDRKSCGLALFAIRVCCFDFEKPEAVRSGFRCSAPGSKALWTCGNITACL